SSRIGVYTHSLFLRKVVKLFVGTNPAVEVRIRPAGRGCPHHPRPDVQDALRTEGAVPRAAGDHHQEQLRAANRPSGPRPAAGTLVLGESAGDSRTQSGPRRAPEAGAPRRRPQIGSTATATMRARGGRARRAELLSSGISYRDNSVCRCGNRLSATERN